MAELLNVSVGYLKHHFPDLCKTLQEKNEALEKAEKLKIEQDLETIVISEELPPPSLNEVSKRLGKSCDYLRRHFPHSSQTISERYVSHHKAVTVELKQILMNFAQSDEIPPPSVITVAAQVGYSERYLWEQFPQECHLISRRYESYFENLKQETGLKLRAIIADETPLPSLEIIAQRLKVSIDYLRDNFPEESGEVINRRQASEINKRLQEEKLIDEVLAEKQDQPMSFNSLSKSFGYDSGYLRSRHPERARQISARYLNHRREQKEQRLNNIAQRIKEAVIELYNGGLYPTQYRVSMCIGQRGCMLNPEIRVLWQRTIDELGLLDSTSSDHN